MLDDELELMILVKAAPVLTSNLEETMCVAAMTLDREPAWIRLHPVPFRDLEDTSRFRKYQEVKLKARRPSADRRPESWQPIIGSIQLGSTVGTDLAWSARRERVLALGERTMCELVEMNRSGSGPTTPSLSVVSAAETPVLEITEREASQVKEWTRRADAIAAQPSLFDDPSTEKPAFEVIPWRFRYRYRCLSPACKGHAQTIIDWEVATLYRNVRRDSDWKNKMEMKLVGELWAETRETVLFVGNQEQHPQSFLVLGVFWPPKSDLQPSLLS